MGLAVAVAPLRPWEQKQIRNVERHGSRRARARGLRGVLGLKVNPVGLKVNRPGHWGWQPNPRLCSNDSRSGRPLPASSADSADRISEQRSMQQPATNCQRLLPYGASPTPPPAAGSNAPSTAMLRRRSQICCLVGYHPNRGNLLAIFWYKLERNRSTAQKSPFTNFPVVRYPEQV